ncbi:nSTAND1 domain-containing NTPase [Streptomyces collinus]|uniref:nSTAND1 domain-containing NTPase n=1 Tax=Streptomyces collinus TaxID=42684 RepID=UPI003442FE5C
MDVGVRGEALAPLSELLSAVAQVLDSGERVAGAGFLVTEDVLVTCAHVVEAAGSGPGEHVSLRFPHVEGVHSMRGLVLAEGWRDPEDEDVAVIRLRGAPAGARPLPLGSTGGCRGHRVRSFGFPAQAPTGGHFGYGQAGDLLPGKGRAGHLQLTGANDLTTGFSGGPVVDEVTGLVVGMLTEIAAPDAYERGQGIAYVIPTRTLREIWPELTVRDVCPYRGLEPFTAEHAQWYEGRKDAVRQVLTNLQQHRVTLLLGPSGSGKSSLVQAGIVPQLAAGALPGSDRWLPVLTRPRKDLLAELERAGLPGASEDGIAEAVTRRLAAEPDAERVVLIIDQFEELLTLPSTRGDVDRRLAATDRITTAVKSHAKLTVILVMRDDFYPHQAALAPKLLEAAVPGLLNIPRTLDEQDLRDIITRPAEAAGACLEHGLPEQIIADVLAITPELAASRRAPVTVLPLLELALSQLWQRRDEGYLTHDAYRRVGGVTGSLTTWCDTALEQLTPGQRPVAQRILTSLVRPADPDHHIPAIRKQVSLRSLRGLAADPDGTSGDGDFDEVLATLVRHRIITTYAPEASDLSRTSTAEPVAELIHDALIRDWDTLRDWVAQDHRFHEWFERTRHQCARWARSGDPGDLLRGTALAEGLDWLQQRRLPDDVTAFITAGKDHQQAAIRRSRRLNSVLATLLVLVLLVSGGVLWQWRTAVAQRQAALSRQLATQSTSLIATQPDAASLLAVAAYRASPTREAAESLANAAALPLRQRLTGHNGPVQALALSPDGRTLATGSTDRTARLWDTATGRLRATLKGHHDLVNTVAFSPDGRTLATGSDDQTVRLWDTATGRTRRSFIADNSYVQSVTFSPDGRLLATGGGDGEVGVWDPATGDPLAYLKGHGDSIQSVAFSSDGRTLASGSWDKTVRLWDTATGTGRVLKGHTDVVRAVAFSPDNRTLASASDDTTVRLWDTATGATSDPLSGHTDFVDALAFSPDGRTLASGSGDNTIRLWDVATRTDRITIKGHTDTVNALAFSRDGRMLASGSTDRTVRMWDMVTGTVRATLTGHTDIVDAVAFRPDGRMLASGGDDKKVDLWDAATGRRRATLQGHTRKVEALAFSPDGRTLASASDDNTVRLWDGATGTLRRLLREHTDVVTSVTFSPDGRTLVTGGRDAHVRQWDVATGRERPHPITLPNKLVGAFAVAVSPDGRTLAVGSSDDYVRLYDARTGRLRAPALQGHTGPVYRVEFSPDGRTLASGSGDNSVVLWDVASATVRTTLNGHTDTVYSVAFSPDGRTLASASADGTVRLWNTATGRTVGILSSHNGAVDSEAFSPDGRTLVTGNDDHTVRLWQVALPRPDTWTQRICRAVGRDLTRQERSQYHLGGSLGHICSSGLQGHA